VRGRIDRAVAADGSETRLSELRGTRFGLLLAIARPDRVARALARRGLHPAARIELADHALASAARLERAAAREQRVKVWLTTAKCALKFPSVVAGSPVLALDHRLDLPKPLVDWALSIGPLPDVFCPSSFGQNPW
jgi:tetraacyldisaccharide-1-P 4'-kinase